MSTNLVNKTTGELVTLANGTRMWIGTQSVHDLAVQQGTMPNNCMVCITDDAAGEEAWQYSTSETRTGKTWIDGKPIYRKVINTGALPAASTKTVSIGVQNIDTVIVLAGIAIQRSTGNVIPLPNTTTDNNNIQIWIENLSTIYIRVIPTWASQYQSFVTIEYTKTTD